MVGAARVGGVGMAGRGGTTTAAAMTWAAAPVIVTDNDVTNLALTLRRGLEVHGRVGYDGSSPVPTPDQLRQPQLRLQPSAGRGRAGNAPVPSNAGADGTFAITEVLPGRYTLVPTGWRQLKWFLKSVNVEGHDASDVPIDISNDL